MTALLYAVQSDHFSCVERLLLAGANQDGVVSSGPTGTYRLSPALLALTSGSVSSLRLLLQAGSRLDLCGRSNPNDEDSNLLDRMASCGSDVVADSNNCSIQNILSSARLDLQVIQLPRVQIGYFPSLLTVINTRRVTLVVLRRCLGDIICAYT